MRDLRLFGACSCLVALLWGCGGGQAPAQTAPPASKPAEPAAPPKASAAAPSATAESKEPPATPPSSGEKPSRPPLDTITAPKVAYQINYPSSAPSEAAEKKCSAAAGDDAKVKAACLKKERSEFFADVIRFKKDAQEKVWFITYRRTGATLITLHKTPVTVTNDGDAAVKVQILGDDKAVRVLFPKAKSFSFRVPNDYSIEIDEPRLGKLIYDAKMDLVTN